MTLIRRNNEKSDVARDVTRGSSVNSLRREIDRVFDWFVQPRWSRDEWFEPLSTWMPSVDLVENDKSIMVRAEVPGIAKDDVRISLSGRTLTISGEKKESKEEKDEDYYHCERRFGSFKRTVELPDTADLEKIDASQENGVLTVRITKKPAATARQIEIKGKSPAREKVAV